MCLSLLYKTKNWYPASMDLEHEAIVVVKLPWDEEGRPNCRPLGTKGNGW